MTKSEMLTELAKPINEIDREKRPASQLPQGFRYMWRDPRHLGMCRDTDYTFTNYNPDCSACRISLRIHAGNYGLCEIEECTDRATSWSGEGNKGNPIRNLRCNKHMKKAGPYYNRVERDNLPFSPTN